MKKIFLTITGLFIAFVIFDYVHFQVTNEAIPGAAELGAFVGKILEVYLFYVLPFKFGIKLYKKFLAKKQLA
jgi:hypothetical protein